MKKSLLSVTIISGIFLANLPCLGAGKATLAKTNVKAEKISRVDQIQSLFGKGQFQSFTEESLNLLTTNPQHEVETRLLNNLENLIFKKFVFLSDAMKSDIQNTKASNKDLKFALMAWLNWQQDKVISYKELYKSSELYKLGVRQNLLQLLLEKKYSDALKLADTLPAATLWKARIYFEAGDYANAIIHFNNISRYSSDFARTREELAWAYYHNRDMDSLFGLLPHLNLPLIPLENKLEARVISAVANLRICQFEDVKNEIKAFQKEILPLVRSIDMQMTKGKFETKGEPAIFAENVYLQAKALYALQSNLKNKTNSENALAVLNKQQKRYWTALKAMTSEAILKMRFVKLELMGQLQKLERMQENKETLGLENLMASTETHTAEALLKTKKEGLLIFPKGEDLWVDELFNQKSLSPNDCEKLQKLALEKSPNEIKK